METTLGKMRDSCYVKKGTGNSDGPTGQTLISEISCALRRATGRTYKTNDEVSETRPASSNGATVDETAAAATMTTTAMSTATRMREWRFEVKGMVEDEEGCECKEQNCT